MQDAGCISPLILVDLNFEAKLPIVTIEGDEFAGGIIHGGESLEKRTRSVGEAGGGIRTGGGLVFVF